MDSELFEIDIVIFQEIAHGWHPSDTNSIGKYIDIYREFVIVFIPYLDWAVFTHECIRFACVISEAGRYIILRWNPNPIRPCEVLIAYGAYAVESLVICEALVRLRLENTWLSPASVFGFGVAWQHIVYHFLAE